MSKWAQKHRWLIAIAVVVLVGLVLFFLSLLCPVAYELCAKSDRAGVPDCAYHHVGPFVLFWIAQAVDDHNGFVTAVATVVMAIFTGVLWFITNKSVNLARDEFTATHRPRVVLQQIHDVKSGSFNGKNAYIEIVLANAGESVAIISQWDARLYFRDEKAALTPFLNGLAIKCSEVGFEIAPGGIKQVAAEHNEVESGHADFRAGAAAMYVAGSVVYSGPDGIERRTGFCRRWSAADDGTWQPVRDAAFEYAY